MKCAIKVIIVQLLAIPASIAITVSILPFWNWLEALTEIESIGHSGPAGWCFIFVYFILSVFGVMLVLNKDDQNANW